MSEIPLRTSVTNHILAGLSAQDFELLAPHLEAVDLPVRRVLERRQRKITKVYFLEKGFASVVGKA
jgi:hypothetical protein